MPCTVPGVSRVVLYLFSPFRFPAATQIDLILKAETPACDGPQQVSCPMDRAHPDGRGTVLVTTLAVDWIDRGGPHTRRIFPVGPTEKTDQTGPDPTRPAWLACSYPAARTMTCGTTSSRQAGQRDICGVCFFRSGREMIRSRWDRPYSTGLVGGASQRLQGLRMRFPLHAGGPWTGNGPGLRLTTQSCGNPYLRLHVCELVFSFRQKRVLHIYFHVGAGRCSSCMRNKCLCDSKYMLMRHAYVYQIKFSQM
jgi:hypothetical protein